MGLETHKIVTGKNVAKIAAQEAEDLTEAVIQLIRQRLAEVPQIQEEIKKIVAQYNQKPGGGRLKASELDEILKKVKYGNDTLYRVKQDIVNEIGDLNRSLGELLTAKGREKYLVDEGLFKDLFEGVHKSNEATIRRGVVGKKFDLFGSDLSKRLSLFEGRLSNYTKAIKAGDAQFTVGHHQHLAGLRDLAVTVKARNDPEWWSEYVRRLNDMGYNPGDLGIVRVDPITHKPYSTTAKGAKSIVGILGEAGVTEKTPGFDRLEKALLDRSAHAGGTGGIKIPALLATKTPEEAVELSKPWLEVEKGRSDQAVRMTSKLKSWQKELQGGKFKNIDDAVTELTRRVELEPDLTKKLGKGSPHDIEQKGIISKVDREAALDKAKILSQSRVAPKLPGDIATVTRPGKAVYKAPGIGIKHVKNVLGIGAKKVGQANVFGRILTHAPKVVANPLVGGQQGHAVGMYQKTGDKKYLKDLGIATATDFGVGATMSGIGHVGSKVAQTGVGKLAIKQAGKGLLKQSLIRGGLGLGARGAIGAAVPVLGWGMLAYTAYDTANQYAKATTGQGLVGHAKDNIQNLLIKPRVDENQTLAKLQMQRLGSLY